jgi:hypothetical protein
VEKLVVAHFLDSFCIAGLRCCDLVVDGAQHELEVERLKKNQRGVQDLRDVS